ncbi:MAG: DUF1465 family protein [Pseudomonadota bacterium]
MVDSKSKHPDEQGAAPVEFGIRFAGSKMFTQIFQDGMGLVEETAAYLDGKGRQDAKRLDRHASIAYATESMRLTTRLMQLASWLLLQRAVGEGEMTPEEAEREKHRASLGDVSHSISKRSERVLPEDLKDLITRSIRLYERITKLDEMLRNNGEPREPASNPLNDQMDKLQAAFGQKR